MTPNALLERIAAGESQMLEFKTSFDKASIASLVAFANTQGGTMLVGVTDAALVQGVSHKELLNAGSSNSETASASNFAVRPKPGATTPKTYEHHCGVVVPPEQPQVFADALLRLAQDAPARARMGLAARRYAEANLHIDAVLGRFVARLEAELLSIC